MEKRQGWLLVALFLVLFWGCVFNAVACADLDANGVFVKVLDFGLSRIPELATDTTASSQSIVGTLAYMAPELLMGKKASRESDLYAVGIIGYELLAGRHPFDTSNLGILTAQILNTAPDVSALGVDGNDIIAMVVEVVVGILTLQLLIL